MPAGTWQPSKLQVSLAFSFLAFSSFVINTFFQHLPHEQLDKYPHIDGTVISVQVDELNNRFLGGKYYETVVHLDTGNRFFIKSTDYETAMIYRRKLYKSMHVDVSYLQQDSNKRGQVVNLESRNRVIYPFAVLSRQHKEIRETVGTTTLVFTLLGIGFFAFYLSDRYYANQGG